MTCEHCNDRGVLTMFAHGDDEPQTLPCPACRPWPQGFTGYRATPGQRFWTIAPYGPGESTATMREVLAP